MSDLSNNERLKLVADALQELNAEVVYVGGAVIQLYSSDGASMDPMTTYDVDCVVDASTYKEYGAFEQKLFARRFINDTSEGAPICRYLFNGEKVDFMPKVDTGIGESNRWYLKGMENKQAYVLDSEKTIFIMPLPYYLASKLDALHSRGGEDYRGEKDFEDIVFILNSCAHLAEELRATVDMEVCNYLYSEFAAMLRRLNIREEIESSILEDNRTDVVIRRIEEVVCCLEQVLRSH